VDDFNQLQEEGMLSALSKTAIAATTALIIGLAPIATADLSHFDGGIAGSRFSEAHFAGGARFAHNDFDRGFHRGFRHRRFVALGGFAGGYDGYCDDPYNYPYPPYGPYGYNYCY
jgi:hypothetical protein